MEKKNKILIAEDESKLALVIKDELTRNNFKVDIASDGNEASTLFAENNYLLIIVDINLPFKNGILLCKEIREKNKKVPILVLTALGQVQDKVIAFEAGADDYMVKPFHFDELLARIKVLIKRTLVIADESNIVIGDLEINFRNKMVTRAGVDISLTAKEFTLLVLLAKNRGKVISKQEILEKVWELSFDTGTNTIEVYISFIRNKIDKPFAKKLIYTKSGFGYFIK